MRIVDHVVRAGAWCDVVALPDGRFAWFYSVSGAMVCEINGVVVWATRVPTDFLRFTRGTAVPELACIGQGDGDQGYIVTKAGALHLGVANSSNPVAFGPDGTRYVVRTANMYTKGAEQVAMPWSSQGIRDVLPDGTVVFGDPTYGGGVGGHSFWQYQTRPGFTVGQAGTNVGLAVLVGKDYMVIPRPGDPLGVHGALSPDGRTLAVCAFTVSGAELWLIDLRVPGPQVNTTEPEKEPSMEPKPLPADVHQIAVELHARNLKLANGSDDDRRVMQQKICETVRARKGPSWGWKSNHGIGLANAKDAIAQLPEGATFTPNERQPIYIWDLFNGSTRQPNPLPLMSGPEAENRQFFVPVQPIDHLAGVVVPDPGKPPVEKPADNSPISEEIAAIKNRLAALEGPRRVALKTHDGTHYLCAEQAGGGDVNATRTSPGPWETFTLEPK